MSDRTRGGPPLNGTGRVPTKDPTAPVASIATTNASKDSRRAPRSMRNGLYGSGWCDGFRAGAADALRQAGRRLPLEAWLVVEQLADEYAMAEVS